MSVVPALTDAARGPTLNGSQGLAMSKPTRGTFACSFCGKQQARVQRLIAGPGPIFICDECVRLCTEIIAEEPRTPGWSPPSHPVGPRKIVPELYCSDFPRSLRFYTEVLGFRVRYTRREERFAYLDLDGAELMLEQTVDPARTFVAGALDYPFGRGMNLEIAVNDADAVYARAQAAGAAIFPAARGALVPPRRGRGRESPVRGHGP